MECRDLLLFDAGGGEVGKELDNINPILWYTAVAYLEFGSSGVSPMGGLPDDVGEVHVM